MPRTRSQQEKRRYARHDDGFSVDAAHDSGARRQTFSPRRNRFPQAGPFHRAHHATAIFIGARAASLPPHQTRLAARRPRRLHDVESLGPPRSVLRRAVRRRHPAYLNLRLHPHEIAAIAKHADDRFLLIDDVLLADLRKVLRQRVVRTRHRRAVWRRQQSRKAPELRGTARRSQRRFSLPRNR